MLLGKRVPAGRKGSRRAASLKKRKERCTVVRKLE